MGRVGERETVGKELSLQPCVLVLQLCSAIFGVFLDFSFVEQIVETCTYYPDCFSGFYLFRSVFGRIFQLFASMASREEGVLSAKCPLMVSHYVTIMARKQQ